MNNTEMAELIARLHREEIERLPHQPLPPTPERPTIHYTELPEDKSGDSPARDWNFYRREIARLLAQGHEGKWVLIKNEKIIGMWNTKEEADRVRLQDYLLQDVLIHEIRTREPLLRGPTFIYTARGMVCGHHP